MVARLIDLTGSKADVETGLMKQQARNSFDLLRKLFSLAPFLLHFDFAKPHIVQVDASAYAVSGIFSPHPETGDSKPVAHYLKKLSPTEQSWQVDDQELGAIIFCFQEWRAWLMGSKDPIIVLSNHANLRYFMKSQTLTSRQARWDSFFSEFHFDILHMPGRNNPADPASRRSDYTSNGLDSAKVTLLGARETECINIAVISLLTRQPRNRVDHTSFMAPTEVLLKDIRAYYHSEDLLQGKKRACLTYDSGTWWWRDRVYVPTQMRHDIMGSVHAPPTAGHWGVAK